MNTPKNENELVEFVQTCARSKTPLKIIGGGTKSTLGYQVHGEPISTGGLTDILLYEPASLTIVCQAGASLQNVEDVLASEGQYLPFEPADYRALLGTTGKATIGGTVACANSGPRRIQVGACRDSLIGVQFINGEGDLIKSGGRVMKNVTGYDLVKLLTGSYGTLGIMTQLSFKLLPAPEHAISVRVLGLSDTKAIEALSAALGSRFDISGAAHCPDVNGAPVTSVRVQGFEKSVAYRAGELSDLLSKFGDVHIENDPDATRQEWVKIRDVAGFVDKPGAVWRLSLKPGDGPHVVAKIKETRNAEALYDWGGGLVWLLTSPDEACGERDIRAAVNAVGGHATLFRQVESSAVEHVFHPQSAPVEAIMENLRRQFDPHSILNSGLMGKA